MRHTVRAGLALPLVVAVLMGASACSSGSGSGGAGASSSSSTTSAASTTTSAPASPAAVAAHYTAGDCTHFSRSAATALLGSINSNVLSSLSGIGKGKRVDICEYGHLSVATRTAAGLGYDILRYPSSGAASSALASAAKEAETRQKARHPVSFAVPGVSGVTDGAWTDPADSTFPATYVAVIGKTVGNYLLVSLSLTTRGTSRSEQIASTVMKTLVSKAG